MFGMALATETVYTHRSALAKEYGFDAQEVVADKFDGEGFCVLGEHPEHGCVTYVGGELPQTLIRWKNRSDQLRAEEAMRLDWEAMFPPSAIEQMRAFGGMARI